MKNGMKRWVGFLAMTGGIAVVVVAFLLILQTWGEQAPVNAIPSDAPGQETGSGADIYTEATDTQTEASKEDNAEEVTTEEPTTEESEVKTTETPETDPTTKVADKVTEVEQTEAQTPEQNETVLWQVLTMSEEEALARGKVIYLTFDDGPSEHTPKLLDILDKYNVKATFFVTGTDPGCFNSIKDAAKRGHAIGIHCYSHWYEEIYSSDEAYLNDMKKMDDTIYELTGIRTKLMRFPGGGSNEVSKKYNVGIMTRLTECVESHGYRFFDWNVDSQDAAGVNEKDKVVENIIASIKMRPVSVVLQHDIYDYSVEAAEEVICWGLQNGYIFLPLTAGVSPEFHHGVVN